MRAVCLFAAVFLTAASAFAATPVEEGVQAYKNGDFEKAEKLLAPYEDQPVFAKLLRVIRSQIKQKELAARGWTQKQLNDIEKMRGGKTALFDRYGMVTHASSKSGATGAIAATALLTRAKAGDANAAWTAGLMYQDGRRAPVNLSNAATLFSIAAAKKHAGAMNNLGFYHRYGIAVKQDEEKALSLFKDALAAGNAFAAYNLAMLHHTSLAHKDAAKAYLYADLALSRLSEKASLRKEKAAANNLRNSAVKRLTPLQRAYLRKYVPADMARDFPKDFAQKRAVSPLYPVLTASGAIVRQTDFMKPVENASFFKQQLARDPESVKDGELEPLLPDLAAYDETAETTDAFDKIKPPAPFPEDDAVKTAVYFRPTLPRAFKLTLNKEKSGMPLMVGDTVELNVFTKLYDDARTQKGAGRTLANTQYDLQYDKNGTLQAAPPVIELLAGAKYSAGFVTLKFQALRAGRNTVRLTPHDAADFPYTFVIDVYKKPDPMPKRKKGSTNL